MAVTTLTLGAYGRAVGHATWLERRAFEVLGRFARATPEPDAKLALAAASAHRGFHATLLEPLLPETRDHDPASLVGPADPAWAERIDGLAGASDTAGRVAAARRLLTAAVDSHESTLATLEPVAEAPARRILILVTAGDRAELASLEGLEIIDAEGGPTRR